MNHRDINNKDIISAQVILKPEKGKGFDKESIITAQTLEKYLPSMESLRQTRDFFSKSGFEIGPAIGNSFSITASAKWFENFFNVHLFYLENGAIMSEWQDTKRYELPIDVIPKWIKDMVMAITFTPPPDFGPTGGY